MDCLYCKQDIDEKTTDFSLRIMLCKRCAGLVAKLKDRIKSELEVLLANLDSTMRFAVTAQDLPGGVETAVSRQALLHFIVHMDERCRSQTTLSSRSTKQSVTIASGD